MGKQRTAQPQRWKQRARRELFLLRNGSTSAICVVAMEVRREGSRGSRGEWRELLSEGFCLRWMAWAFCLFGEGFNLLSTWQESIGWRKTLVLRHSLIECFLYFDLQLIPFLTIGFNCVDWLLYNSQIDSSPLWNVYAEALLKNEFEWQLKSTTQINFLFPQSTYCVILLVVFWNTYE